MNLLTMVFLIGSFAALEGCASTFQAKPEHQSDFFSQTAMVGVASEAVVPHVHPQTKVNWSAYDKIKLNPVVIADDFSRELSSEQKTNLNELAKAFHDMLAQRLAQDYALVEKPASGSLLIQVAITHAERSWVAPQVLSKVSWQLQALNSVLTYFRGKPAFAGEITIEFTVRDSVTGQLLLIGIDRRVGGQNLFDKEVFNSWGDVQNSLEFWTEQSAYQLCLARKGFHCSQPKA